MTPGVPLHVLWLGTRQYTPVYELQCELAEKRKLDLIEDVVLLLEHEATITQGRGAKQQHLLSSKTTLAANSIEVVETDRGGDVTLHAPGQLVAYPIIKLHGPERDVRKYVNRLTSVMQQLVAHYGIAAGTAPGMVGLWTDRHAPQSYTAFESAKTPVKVGAIGVRISRWVTMHGFALNLTTDLSLFSHIVPCGISSHGVGSIQSLTGLLPTVREAADVAAPLFAQTLGRLVPGLKNWDGPLSALSTELSATANPGAIHNAMHAP
jgi:lipoyl(octanoyl) transferase